MKTLFSTVLSGVSLGANRLRYRWGIAVAGEGDGSLRLKEKVGAGTRVIRLGAIGSQSSSVGTERVRVRSLWLAEAVLCRKQRAAVGAGRWWERPVGEAGVVEEILVVLLRGRFSATLLRAERNTVRTRIKASARRQLETTSVAIVNLCLLESRRVVVS